MAGGERFGGQGFAGFDSFGRHRQIVERWVAHLTSAEVGSEVIVGLHGRFPGCLWEQEQFGLQTVLVPGTYHGVSVEQGHADQGGRLDDRANGNRWIGAFNLDDCWVRHPDPSGEFVNRPAATQSIRLHRDPQQP